MDRDSSEKAGGHRGPAAHTCHMASDKRRDIGAVKGQERRGRMQAGLLDVEVTYFLSNACEVMAS